MLFNCPIRIRKQKQAKGNYYLGVCSFFVAPLSTNLCLFGMVPDEIGRALRHCSPKAIHRLKSARNIKSDPNFCSCPVARCEVHASQVRQAVPTLDPALVAPTKVPRAGHPGSSLVLGRASLAIGNLQRQFSLYTS